MDSRKKRSASRSASRSERVGSVTPSKPRASRKPSGTKSAHLLGLSSESPMANPESVASPTKLQLSSRSPARSERVRSVIPSKLRAFRKPSAAKSAHVSGPSSESPMAKPESVASPRKQKLSSLSAARSGRSSSVTPSKPSVSKSAHVLGLMPKPECVASPTKQNRSLARSDKSRLDTPIKRRASRKPSMAGSSHMVGVSLEGPNGKSECMEPPKQQVLDSQKPVGSLRVRTDLVKEPPVDIAHLHVIDPSSQSENVLEPVEVMETSDEEVVEMVQIGPWHVQQWVDFEQQGQECSVQVPLSTSTAAEDLSTPDFRVEEIDDVQLLLALQGQECSVPTPLPSTTTAGEDLGTPDFCVQDIDDLQLILEVTSTDPEVGPSTSELMDETEPVGGREDQGSDFDSEFDDELDGELEDLPIETIALAGGGRDIPDDEELEQPVREVVHAVERAMDEEADRLLGVSTSFDWNEGFESFRGVPEEFSGPTPGAVKDYDTPYDAFTDIWSKDIMELIARETNRYAKQTIRSMKAKGTLKKTSRLHNWRETNADEIAVMLAIFMYMGIDYRTSQYEYWKANDYLEMPRFKEIMPYRRFLLLSKFFHFVDNAASRDLPESRISTSAKLAKLQPLITHLSAKFCSLYNLHREISIDESLTLFKGRLSFVQTIRTKAARFGIKSYELCESKTGYLYRFSIYTGKNDSSAVAPSHDLGSKTTEVVLGLLKDLQHRGHCVTMDNFYNSPLLARHLKSQGFDCLGTLRTNRKHVPSDISRVPRNVEKGTIISRQCGDVSIITWKDSILVTMISTYHTDETYVGSRAGKNLVKPVCVKDYNRTMGGVDLKDQKLSMYLLERKRGMKWYIKMFKRLLNVSILNAFVIYNSSLQRRNMDVMSHRDFRYNLAKSLVDKHHQSPPEMREYVGEITRLRRNVVHVPRYESGRNNRKRCTVCYRQSIDKMVHTQCVTCGEYLCFGTCWKEWHSLKKLKGKESRGRKRFRI